MAILALLVGIIVLLIKGGPAVRWFFGILLLLLVIGFLGVLPMRAANVPLPVRVAQSTLSATQLQGPIVHIDKNPTVWAEGLEEELTPDVYSTLGTAAYGLGAQLKETIDNLSHAPKKITILESDDNDLALLEHFRRGLQFVLPESDILIASSKSNPECNVWITVRRQQDTPVEITVPEIQQVDMIHMAQTLHIGNQRGSLQAIVQTIDNKFAKNVEYDYRAWLQNSETFRLQIGGRGSWAVITSDETAITKEQARQQAIENACGYVSEQLEPQGITQKAVTEADLKNYGFIVDEYDQRLQGLSGSIWRSAMLLDVSPQRIQSLRQQQITVHQIQRKTWAFQIFSLVGMLILISILYLFVNAITKGYYSTTILIVAVIAFLVFLFLFLA